MSKPRGVVEPSMVSVSVNAYTGGVSKSGYYEGEGEARTATSSRARKPRQSRSCDQL